MTADQDVDNQLDGVEADGQTPLSFARVYNRARYIADTTLNEQAFTWPQPAPATSPSSTSRYDQIQVTAEQNAWRFVDSVGNVWDQNLFHFVMIELLITGALGATPAQVAQAMANANVLRAWPTGFKGAFPGDPQETYPAWPPAAPTPAPAPAS